MMVDLGMTGGSAKWQLQEPPCRDEVIVEEAKDGITQFVLDVDDTLDVHLKFRKQSGLQMLLYSKTNTAM